MITARRGSLSLNEWLNVEKFAAKHIAPKPEDAALKVI